MKRSLVYAGRLERFLAFLIDYIVVLIAMQFVASFFVRTDGHVPTLDTLVIPALYLVQLTYYTYFTSSRWQATPAKRLLGIYVIRTDNRMLTPRDALERFLAFSMPFLPFYASFLPVGVVQLLVMALIVYWYSPVLYMPQRTAMHDRLCQTRVLIGRVGK